MQRLAVLRTAVLGLAAVSLFARFFQDWLLPGAGLDPSWAWGINQAAARGLVFGRDIVFNFGPYGSVATGQYDPSLRWAMLGGGAILGLGFTASLLALLARRPLLLLCATAVSPVLTTMGALSFALPLPALLLCAETDPGAPLGGFQLCAVLAALPALGLLPLVKGSFLSVTIIGAAGLSVLLWQSAQRRLAVAVPAIVAASMVLLWAASGQPVSALPAYLATMLSIISGYSDAMATPGSARGIAVAAFCAAAFLALLASHARRLPRNTALPLMAATALLLWIAFKAGYVRQNEGREADTLATFGLMFIVLAGWLRTVPSAMAAATGVILLLAPSYTPGWQGPPYRLMLGGPGPGIAHAWSVLARPDAAAKAYAIAAARVPALPWHPPGTADVYSFDQAALFAAGLAWAPRPMFQSYSAYTPALAALNAANLLAARAPGNVFFRVEPIDGRFPALEDGPSWPALLSRYDALAYDGDTGFAWLHKSKTPAGLPAPGQPVLDARRFLGQDFELPSGIDDLWARIELQPSLAGRVAQVLMRAPQPVIKLTFADGSTRTFRLVPGMARAGFLLSPVVSSTLDFLRLRLRDAAPDRPVKMDVETANGGGWAWRHRYRITLAPIAFPPAIAQLRFEHAIQPKAVNAPPSIADAVCALDGANGESLPASRILTASGPLVLSGWELFDAATGVQPDRMALGFLSAGGAVYAVPTSVLARPDVASVFHLAEADRAGFSVTADVSDLPPGDYSVVGLPQHGGSMRLCRTYLTVHVTPK
jgi:hypothetical protein